MTGVLILGVFTALAVVLHCLLSANDLPPFSDDDDIQAQMDALSDLRRDAERRAAARAAAAADLGRRS